MRTEISYGRLMMMGDEERAKYLASQMTTDSSDDVAQDDQVTIEVYRIRNQRSVGDLLLEQLDFTERRQSPIRSLGETEVRHYIPTPSTVSHAQREPSEWAKNFVWGNNSTPLPKKESTARIWHARKPVPVLEHVAFGSEGFMDDICHAYAESVGIEAYEVNIGIEEVIYL